MARSPRCDRLRAWVETQPSRSAVTCTFVLSHALSASGAAGGVHDVLVSVGTPAPNPPVDIINISDQRAAKSRPPTVSLTATDPQVDPISFALTAAPSAPLGANVKFSNATVAPVRPPLRPCSAASDGRTHCASGSPDPSKYSAARRTACCGLLPRRLGYPAVVDCVERFDHQLPHAPNVITMTTASMCPRPTDQVQTD